MIRGMTGFGRSSREQAGSKVSVEIRTVNHRYCEIQLRLHRSLAALEPSLRRRIAARVGRGRADVAIRWERLDGEPFKLAINRPMVEGILAGAESLRAEYGLEGTLDLATVLRFPDVMTTRSEEEEIGQENARLLEEAVDEALDRVDEMRRDEGRVIAADLGPRLEQIQRRRQEMAGRAGEIPQQIRRRLEKRLGDLLPADSRLDPGRLEQEAAVLADRADITEELVRLEGYIEQALAVLTDGGTGNGRRLDFLVQEMLREVNTIGAKAGERRMMTSLPGRFTPQRGNLVVLSAPSGTGKTTIARSLVEKVPNLQASVSYTTRRRREGEREGQDYRFVDRSTFQQMAATGGFLEWAEIYGDLYGTGGEATEAVIAGGNDLLLVIDVQGARQVRERVPGALFIFLLPPDYEALLARLRKRGTESSGTETQRLAVAREEIRVWTEYDYLIVNDDLSLSRDAAIAVVMADRQSRRRMAAMAEEIVSTFPTPAGSR
jgi:guanylate kinase